MHIVFLIIYVITVLMGLFFFDKSRILDEKVCELEEKLHEEKLLKHKAKVIKIKDYMEAYERGENPFTILARIRDTINETALDENRID